VAPDDAELPGVMGAKHTCCPWSVAAREEPEFWPRITPCPSGDMALDFDSPVGALLAGEGARPHAQVPVRRGCEVRGDEGAVRCQGVDATASASAMAGCRREAAMVGEGRSSI
jgi:hypothetical protein